MAPHEIQREEEGYAALFTRLSGNFEMFQQELKRYVFGLDVDWVVFHRILDRVLVEAVKTRRVNTEQCDDGSCGHGLVGCRLILAAMGLDSEDVEACVDYFLGRGGYCDFGVAMYVDMTDPQSHKFRRLQARETGASTVPMDVDEIQRDLEERAEGHRESMRIEQELERDVLGFDVDWVKFHRLLDEAVKTERVDTSRCEDGDCHHGYARCRHILAGMGLDREDVEACVVYFSPQGGDCDFGVAMFVDMTNPRPLTDFACADCRHDFDEYYMVHDYIWEASGIGEGILCIGCLENRIGRTLCAQDFIDALVNDINYGIKSLRLKDRLTSCAPEFAQRQPDRPASIEIKNAEIVSEDSNNESDGITEAPPLSPEVEKFETADEEGPKACELCPKENR